MSGTGKRMAPARRGSRQASCDPAQEAPAREGRVRGRVSSRPVPTAPGRGGSKQVSIAPPRGGGGQVSDFQAPRQVETYRMESQFSHVDKRTGGYQRTTSKQEASTGQVFRETGSGRMGYMDEFKNATTVCVGDRYGYDEYRVEETRRRVNFGNSGKKGYGGGSSSGRRYLQH